MWMAAVAIAILTGWIASWGEAGYLLFSVFAMLTVTALPYALTRRHPLALSYLLKINVFAGILVVFGTYFGTHYFFDLMGMKYAFPVRWVFDAQLLGRSGQHVPVFMYPLTQAYFVTYFTGLVVLDRGIAAKLRLGRIGRVGLLLALSYAVAFGETFFMATDLMKELFSYDKRSKMLAFGSIGYATYFVVGLPTVRNVDERPGAAASVGRVTMDALAASMLILVLLEVWAKIVGPL